MAVVDKSLRLSIAEGERIVSLVFSAFLLRVPAAFPVLHLEAAGSRGNRWNSVTQQKQKSFVLSWLSKGLSARRAQGGAWGCGCSQ